MNEEHDDTQQELSSSDLKDLLNDWRQQGYDRGYNIAGYQEAPVYGYDAKGVQDCNIGRVEDESDAEEVFLKMCFDAEQNNRSFSPFEFVCREINDHPYRDEIWEAYEEGIDEGFQEYYQQNVKQEVLDSIEEHEQEELEDEDDDGLEDDEEIEDENSEEDDGDIEGTEGD